MKFGVLSQRGLSSQNLGVAILPVPSSSISPAPSPSTLTLSFQRSELPRGSVPDTDAETPLGESSLTESPCVEIPIGAATSNNSSTSNSPSFPQKVAPNFPLISRRSVLQGGARCALGGIAGAIAGACGLRSEAWAAPAPSLGVTWRPVQFSGRDYLPLEQVGRFYGMGTVQRAGKECLLGSGEKTLRGAADSTDFFISRIKCVLSYPLAEVGASVCISRLDLVKLVEPVLRPFKIDGAERVETIVLDAGHGGSDRGAVGRLGDEKTFTLDVAMRTGQLLSRAGYKVVFTRTSDEFVSLEERVQVANRLSRALFISVHFNSGGSGSGVETFALSPRGVPSMSNEGARVSDFGVYPGNSRDPENTAWATAAHAAMIARCGMIDRGIKRARFYVIRESNLPSVLIEGGFLSHSEDMQRIASPWYRQQLAGSILEAVRNYRRAVGGSMT